ncbi:VanZ family protein [Fibrella forsythiae]|uniref:VanZ family protein n=1 Tax=Fibrella forsythiae TaxID=2817061 RepID=UPI0035B59F23
MRHVPILFILGVGIIIICFLSWLPTPNLGVYGFLPRWITQWTDNTANMNIRTAIPLGLLGICCGLWLLLGKRTWASWLAMLLVLIAVVSIAEIGQLMLPFRHFDWGDISWGIIGACTGLGLIALIRLVWTRCHLFK